MRNLFCACLLLATLTFPFHSTFAQDNVGIGTTTPSPGAILELSANDKGFLMTRLSSGDTITYGALFVPGMMFYASDIDLIMYYDGSRWRTLTYGEPNYWSASGSDIYNINPGRVGIGTNTPLGNLHVENTDWNSNAVYLNSTATSAGSTIRFVNPQTGNHTYDLIGSTGSGAAIGVGAFGVWDNTASSYRFVIRPTGEIGMGTNVPLNNLDLEGNMAIGSSYSGSSIAPVNGLIVEGNVGIGTPSPTAKLVVNGVSQVVRVENTGGGYAAIDVSSNGGLAMLRFAQLGSSEAGVYWDPSSSTLQNFIFGEPDQGIILRSGSRIGLGEVAPINTLDVDGDAVIGTGYSGSVSAPANGLLVQGNVGIGNTSPSYPLDVTGDINSSGSYFLGGNEFISSNLSNTVKVGVLAGHVNVASFSTHIGHQAGAVSTGISNTFVGYQAGLDNTTGGQNDFFGIRAGENNLTGSSNSFLGRSAGNSNSSGSENVFVGRNAGGSNTTGNQNTIIGEGANVGSGSLVNATAIGNAAVVSSSNTLVLGNNANVGIGTSSVSSAYKLHVNAASGGLARYAVLAQADYDGSSASYGLFSWMTGGGSGTHYGVYISNGSATTGTEYGIYSTGEDRNYFSATVGIATTVPTTQARLHVAGGDIAMDANADNGIKWVTGNTMEAHLFRWSNNDNLYVTNNGSANLTGVYLADGATWWTSTSDLRLKENIVETSYGLEDLLQLSVKEYNYKTTPEKDKEIGMIAQEVYEVIPEIVQKGDDGAYRGAGNSELSMEAGFSPWGIEYSGLIPILVKSVQELKAENDLLRKRIEALEIDQK